MKKQHYKIQTEIFKDFRDEMRKFFVDVEDICSAINSGEVWLGDDYYVFPTQAERDEEFNKLMEETK